MTSTVLSLPQMVDLALSSPEVGAVNFSVLHSLLHVLIQQVDLLDTKVEFKGVQNDKIQVMLQGNTLGSAGLELTEYVIVPGSEPKKVISKKDRLKKILAEESGDTEIFVERKMEVVDDDTTFKEKLEIETVVVLNSGEDFAQPVLLHSKVQRLEDEIDQIKEEICQFHDLPSNENLFKATRTNTPVRDFIQNLSLTKRVEAVEEATAKLATLIQDLVKDQGGDYYDVTRKRSSSTYSFAAILNERVTKLEEDMQRFHEHSSTTAFEQNEEESDGDLYARIMALEGKLQECTECVCSVANAVEEQTKSVQSQIDNLENNVEELTEQVSINSGKLPDAESITSGNEIQKKIGSLQEEFEKFSTMVSKEFLEQQQSPSLSVINIIQDEIELLKRDKADRKYVLDMLAEKEDATLIKKISVSRFESTYNDIYQSLDETIKKLNVQESGWKQALLDIQQEIENKLDKLELTDLRNFINEKLKTLNDKVKSFARSMPDPVAAGTKTPLLKNVRCISCDAEVVMRKEIDTSSYPSPTVKLNARGLGPYLAYELDQLRRQQKCSPHGRNLLHFEKAVHRDGVGVKEHICNRYCGGSHTITTPQQRVLKIGNFLQQWSNGQDNVKNDEGPNAYQEGGDFTQIPTKLEVTSERKNPTTADDTSSNRSRSAAKSR